MTSNPNSPSANTGFLYLISTLVAAVAVLFLGKYLNCNWKLHFSFMPKGGREEVDG